MLKEFRTFVEQIAMRYGVTYGCDKMTMDVPENMFDTMALEFSQGMRYIDYDTLKKQNKFTMHVNASSGKLTVTCKEKDEIQKRAEQIKALDQARYDAMQASRANIFQQGTSAFMKTRVKLYREIKKHYSGEVVLGDIWRSTKSDKRDFPEFQVVGYEEKWVEY